MQLSCHLCIADRCPLFLPSCCVQQKKHWSLARGVPHPLLFSVLKHVACLCQDGLNHLFHEVANDPCFVQADWTFTNPVD